jgi:TolB-like protein/Flp pilus assembly protein TadD
MGMASKLSVFFGELKRRKVYRVAAVYAVVGVGILGAAEVILDPLGLEALRPYLVILVLLGFPIALVLAWAYEVKPQESREVAEAAGPVGATPESDRKSIVVLPFDNMSPDPGDAYFSDGLTEEIITNLSRVRSLRVISRSSAMALKGTQKDVRTIGRELDVHYVLEGSVRKAENDLRITAQLIDATSDEHLWAERYDGVLEDVFSIQEDVAASIVASLQIELGPDEARHLTEHPLRDLQAYECFLRASQEIFRFTKEAIKRTIAYLEEALDLVGENALLLAGLAYAHSQLANIGEALKVSYQRAEEYALRALDLDPECGQAHLVLGTILLNRREPAKGISHLERAVEVNPNDSTSLSWLAFGYSLTGQGDALRSSVQQAVRADPLSPHVQSLLGFMAIMEGRFDEGAEHYQELDRADPGNPMAIFLWGLALAWGQRLDEALSLLTERVPEESTNSFSRFSLLLKYAIQGDAERMDRLVEGDFRETLHNDTQLMFMTASAYALVGMKGKAVDWLQRAFLAGFTNYPWLTEHDPFLSALRGEPRYEAVLERVKDRWMMLEV